MELTSLVSRETLLEAVLLWIIPFFAALSIAEIAFFKAASAPSLLSFATSCSTFLDRVFNIFLTDLFFSVIASVCLFLLRADLLFFGAAFAGKVLPPFKILIYHERKRNITDTK